MLPKPRVLSVCGNVTSSLHLLAQTGADAISIDQTVDLAAARLALKDTLFNMEKEKQLTRKEMNYKFDKKEAATKAEQDKKDAMTAEGKKNQRMVIYFISGGLVLLLVLIVFIVTGYRQKIRSNNIIALKNEEV